VEEEGEIFRKGAVLLGPEEMEGEYAGEELRREVSASVVQLGTHFDYSRSCWRPWLNGPLLVVSSMNLVSS